MRTHRCETGGISLPETVVASLAALLLGVAFVMPALLKARTPSSQSMCASNIQQIGLAMAAYYSQYQDYYPFIESPFVTDSLSLLYPDFMANCRIFRCPSTEDTPGIVVDFRAIKDDAGFYRARTWFGDENGRALAAPLWSSYGYDDRIPKAASNVCDVAPGDVILGDMDGSFASGRGDTPNHRDWMNALRADGSVNWAETAYCSTNPLDNIFARDGWAAETDSWIRRP